MKNFRHISQFLIAVSLLGFDLLLNFSVAAGVGLPAVTVSQAADGGETFTLSIQVLALMTALTFIPAALIMMTSFTRIIIVLAIVRQAVGLAQTPSNQVLIGLSLFLTMFIMYPVFDRVYKDVGEPYINEEISFKEALMKASVPFRSFMLDQTRSSDLVMFSQIADKSKNADKEDSEADPVDSEIVPEEQSFAVVLTAFVTSELKTAFQIGFLIFIPFLIIDLVVASVLMSMGMMMLSPMINYIPFKIMLFVLIDGWTLIMGTLASSFYI